MKHLSRIITLTLILFVGCTFTIPDAAGTLESYAAAKMQISKKKATITKGKTIKLRVKNTKGKKVRWSSSKTKIATVKKGTVTAKNSGKTTITAKVGKKTFRCKITVKNPVNYKKKIVGMWEGEWGNGSYAQWEFTKSGHFYFTFYDDCGGNSTDGTYSIHGKKLCLSTYETYTIKSITRNIFTIKTYWGTFKLHRTHV